jgi:zinc protease
MRRAHRHASLPCLLVLVLLWGCATAPRPRSIQPGALSNAVFPSGMRLVVREDSRAKLMTMYVSYRAGATDEPEGKEGVAELAARLSLRARHGGAGTPTLEERLVAADVTPRSTITYDDTELWSSLSPERLARAAALEAQRMADPLAHVTEEDFRQVRAQQLDELWVSQEAMDKGPSRRWLHEKLLAGHVYGRPAQGMPESLDRLTLEDVRAFVKANYTPAHAVLVVSGPLPLEEAKSEVARSLAGLMGVGTGAPASPVQRAPPPAPEDLPERAPPVVVHGAVSAPQLHFLLTVPGRYSGRYAESLVAREVLKRWLDLSLGQDSLSFRRTATVTFQELDGLTLLHCSVVLRSGMPERMALHHVSSLLSSLEVFGNGITESLREPANGPRRLYQRKYNAPMPFRSYTEGWVRATLNQELELQARTVSAMDIARVVRATGRVDLGGVREEQVARALAEGVLPSYLEQYMRAERMRTLVILPEPGAAASPFMKP